MIEFWSNVRYNLTPRSDLLVLCSPRLKYDSLQSLTATYYNQNYYDLTSPLYLSSDLDIEQYIVRNCSFTNCSNYQTQGGAISSSVTNGGVIISISNTSFVSCFCGNDGGAIWISVGSGSKVTIEDCRMTNCHSAKNGGGICIVQHSTDIQGIELKDIQMFNCTCQTSGGGIFVETHDNSTLSLIGDFLFDNCSSINSDGGGIYVQQKQPMHSIQMQGNFTFRNCTSRSYGGGMYMQGLNQTPVAINCTLLFWNCTSGYGGGLRLIYQGTGQATHFAGNFTFERCSANKG
ncbi:MAG: hypothetical protein EZS28_040627, partial [Streblomastix strix]